jgi:hypothetical protein
LIISELYVGKIVNDFDTKYINKYHKNYFKKLYISGSKDISFNCTLIKLLISCTMLLLFSNLILALYKSKSEPLRNLGYSLSISIFGLI